MLSQDQVQGLAGPEPHWEPRFYGYDGHYNVRCLTDLIPKSKKYLWLVVLIASIALCGYGLYRGEAAEVLQKARIICLECIGRMKRRPFQLISTLITNSYVQGLFLGQPIYQGPLKYFCVPSFNCYSCPLAIFACPIGAMQAVAAGFAYQFAFYAFGILAAVGWRLAGRPARS